MAGARNPRARARAPLTNGPPEEPPPPKPPLSAIRLWTLLTAGFVTPNPVKALVEVGLLLLLARIVEPIHGSAEVSRLVAATALFSGAATLALSYVLFAASPAKSEAVLYAHFGGFHCVVGGLLVALKQAVPDAELRPFGGGGGGGGGGLLDGGADGGLAAAASLRARYAPLAFVLAGAALALPLGGWTALPYLFFGVYGAWLYLRFWQPQPGGGGPVAGAGAASAQQLPLLRGDPSPEFRFATFFPDVLAPPIDAAAGALSALLRVGQGSAAARRSAAVAAAPAPGWGGFGGEAKALLGGGDWASVLSTAGGAGLNAAMAAGRAAAAGVGGVGGVAAGGTSTPPLGGADSDPNAQRRRERGKAALEQKLGALQKAAMGAAAAAGRAVAGGGGGGGAAAAAGPASRAAAAAAAAEDLEGGGGPATTSEAAPAASGPAGEGAAAAIDAVEGPRAHELSPGPTALGGIAVGGGDGDTADSAAAGEGEGIK
jgi:hypothetical protein